jgi:hypothetical protein
VTPSAGGAIIVANTAPPATTTFLKFNPFRTFLVNPEKLALNSSFLFHELDLSQTSYNNIRLNYIWWMSFWPCDIIILGFKVK